MKTTNRIGRLALLLVVMTALSACNTISGMGKDVQAGGRAVEKAAEKTKEKM